MVYEKIITLTERCVSFAKEGVSLIEPAVSSTSKKLKIFTPKSYENVDEYINTLSCKRSQICEILKIKPKCLGYASFDTNRIIGRVRPDELNYNAKYIEADCGRFHKKYNPTVLPQVKPNGNTIFLSNYVYPRGSVGAFSTLDREISTAGIFQCASVAIVDKTHNTQSLLHISPFVSKDRSGELIKHVISNSNSKDLKISIIPGCFDESDFTVDFIVNTIKKLVPNQKINFVNFPRTVDYYDRAVILRNGELSCCDVSEITKNNINPKNNLLYFKKIYHKNRVINYFKTLYDKYLCINKSKY